MRRPLVVLPVLVFVGALLCASTATAERAHVGDPAGDGQDGRLLDMTHIRVDNDDQTVETRLTFSRVALGDLYVYYWLRGTDPPRGGWVTSKLRPRKVVTTMRDGEGNLVPCKRLVVDWDTDADTATISFPSRCLGRGDYGAIRVRAITERAGSGLDLDYAPKNDDGDWRWSRWIPRG